MALPQKVITFSHGQHLFSGRTVAFARLTILFILIVIFTFACSVCASNDAQQFHATANKSAKVTSIRSTPEARTLALSIEKSSDEDSSTNDNENYHYDDESTAGEEVGEDDESSVTTETPIENSVSGNDVVVEPSATSLESTVAEESSSSKREIEVPVSAVDTETLNDNEEEVATEVIGDELEDEDDFCTHNYVDSAYFNGYDTILTRGDRLWYYYKEQHKISKAFDQRRFTQGECQLCLFLVKNCCENVHMRS